jgi:hypothetical protein
VPPASMRSAISIVLPAPPTNDSSVVTAARIGFASFRCHVLDLPRAVARSGLLLQERGPLLFLGPGAWSPAAVKNLRT